MLRTVTHVESHVKISRCVENVILGMLKTILKTVLKYKKKAPSHFTVRVEIEQQVSFFSFGFACVSEVRHIFFPFFIYMK